MASPPRELVTTDPDVMDGVAVFTDSRLPITTVLASLANGMDLSRLQESWPFLTDAHVEAARAYLQANPEPRRPRSIAEVHPDWVGTDRGVLRPPRTTRTVVDQLAMPQAGDVEFEPPKAVIESPPADLSDALSHMPDVGRDADFARGEQDARRQRWLAENKSALESSNEFVDKNGLPLSIPKTDGN